MNSGSRDERRITLVVADDFSPLRLWNDYDEAGPRIIFVRNVQILEYVMASHHEADVERIIVDHVTAPSEMLEVLVGVGDKFHGDVLLLSKEASYISASTLGDGRTLSRITDSDASYYLDVHGLAEAPRARNTVGHSPAATSALALTM